MHQSIVIIMGLIGFASAVTASIMLVRLYEQDRAEQLELVRQAFILARALASEPATVVLALQRSNKELFMQLGKGN